MIRMTCGALIMIALAAPAFAQSAGDWTVGIGAANVDPKDDNGDLAGGRTEIGKSARPSFTLEYFVRDNLGIEVLAATPFKHDVYIRGVGKATTKQLPPTVSLVYHFANDTKYTPFIGAGVNYTAFFSEHSALGNVKIDDSWGIALMGGLDYQVSENGALRVEARWIDIGSDVTLGGSKIGEVDVDPLVLGAYYVHRF